jgi:hypothetical protein
MTKVTTPPSRSLSDTRILHDDISPKCAVLIRNCELWEAISAPLRGKLGYTMAISGVVGKSNSAENAPQPTSEGTTTGVTYYTDSAQSEGRRI